MKPLRVWARNYGPYAEVDWTIPEGVTAILGRNDGSEGISSNGAGKTRLLELLPIALWGPTAPWTDYLTTGSADPTCEVGCEFSHAGGVYRVRRTFSAAGRGKTTLDFERLFVSGDFGPDEPTTAEVWQPLTQENQAGSQESIRRLLGVGEATFSHSVFAAQGARHFADAELTPRERFEILADGLGLEVWENHFRQLAAADRQRLQTELEGLRARLGDWETQLADRADVEERVATVTVEVHELEADLATARRNQQRLDDEYKEAREARTTIDAASRECNALQSSVAQLEQQHEAAKTAKAEAEALTASIEQTRTAAAEVDALAATAAELSQAAGARATALDRQQWSLNGAENERTASSKLLVLSNELDAQRVAKLQELERLAAAGQGVCDRCQQPVRGGALVVTVEKLTAEVATLAEQIEKHNADSEERLRKVAELEAQAAAVVIPAETDDAALKVANERLISARNAATELARLEERQRGLQEAAAGADDPEFAARVEKAKTDATAAATRVAELSAAVVSEERVQELAVEALGARVAMEKVEGELGTARTTLGAVQERARTLEEVAGRNAEAIGIANRIEFDLLVRVDLEKAYGRAGIPMLLLESLYIPQIEQEADRILAAWGVSYTVELVTQKQQKTSDRLKDTLEIVIHEPRGIRRYQTYSGGERDRINVALRIALTRVLSHRRGATLEVFALDELAHLDAAGVAKLAELLAELQREIPVVLFISHDSQLTDAFSQRVTVVRDGGSSHLEVAA